MAIHGSPGEDGKIQGYLDMQASPILVVIQWFRQSLSIRPL